MKSKVRKREGQRREGVSLVRRVTGKARSETSITQGEGRREETMKEVWIWQTQQEKARPGNHAFAGFMRSLLKLGTKPTESFPPPCVARPLAIESS